MQRLISVGLLVLSSFPLYASSIQEDRCAQRTYTECLGKCDVESTNINCEEACRDDSERQCLNTEALGVNE